MSENDNTITVGEILQKARLEAELTLDGLSEKTRIATHLLEALEKDEYHQISGELYVKSFLRTVCGQIGLDADEVLAKYGEQVGKPLPTPVESTAAEDPMPMSVTPIMARTIDAPGVDEEPEGSDVWSVDSVVVRKASAVSLVFWYKVGGAVLAVALLLWLLISQPWKGDGQPAQADVPASETTTEVEPETASADTVVSVADDPPPEEEVEQTPAPVQPAPATSTRALVSAPSWSDGLDFDGGSPPLVLRLLCSAPVALRVESDDQFEMDAWSHSPVPLPVGDLQLGRPYQVLEGLVVFWGANDHFLIRLESRAGMLSLLMNDQPLDLPDSIIGRAYVLDRFQLQD